MRDDVRLAANIFLPIDAAARYPTILVRTPYGKGTGITPHYQAFVDRGYAIVAQDVRGRHGSEGSFAPLTQEPQDGWDTIEWIAAQSWSNGKVGMMGGSYLGMTQWEVAVLNNPHLKAIFPVVSGDDDYRDRMYSPGGAMKWGHRLLWVAENMREPGYVPPTFQRFIWTLPPRRADRAVTGATANILQAAFNHPSYDSYWKEVSVREKLKSCRVPVFAVGGWFDNYVEGDLDAFSILHQSGGTNHLVVGPWPHNIVAPIKNIDFGQQSLISIRKLQLEWFDHHLKGRPEVPVPPMRIFVMGANEWRDENEWPPARAINMHLYLRSAGGANSAAGDGTLSEHKPHHKEPADHFIYDPRNPVPTLGGAVCCNGTIFPWGPIDQRAVERRKDVLVYTSDVLRDEVEVTGPVSMTLYVSTSAPDTDITGKLVDVYPDGRAMNLTDGILRLRYRGGLEKPKLLSSNQPVKVTVFLGSTSNVFRRGHRIRLEISSSNFPRFDRNPNTGKNIADEIQLVKAAQTVFHDHAQSSILVLPIVPSRSAAPVLDSRPKTPVAETRGRVNSASYRAAR